jgi:hypothetical protein
MHHPFATKAKERKKNWSSDGVRKMRHFTIKFDFLFLARDQRGYASP